MSNYSSCLSILTNLIGFEKINNGEKIALPDEVEIDTLAMFNDYLIDFKNDDSNNDNNNNNETFWACSHCTYRNSIDLNACQMCGLPSKVNVCITYLCIQ